MFKEVEIESIEALEHVATGRELRVIREDRTHPGDHSAGARAKPMHVTARCIAGDPATLPIRHRCTAVE